MTVIALALDGLDTCMLELEELSTLSSLFKERYSSTLTSTIPYITPVAFASMQTGKDPSIHGINYFFKNVNPFLNMPIKFYTSADIKEKTFYEILHQYNKKCFIFGLPFTYPPKISGDLIFDWFSGLRDVNSLVYPNNLFDEYTSIKELTLFPEDSLALMTKITNIYKSAKSISNIIIDVVKSHKYDFCFFYIGAPDQLAHAVLADVLDNEKKDYVKVAKETFSVVDHTVSNIIKELRSDDMLIIFSDHGHHLYDYTLNLNNWLYENGFLTYTNNPSSINTNASHVFRNLHFMVEQSEKVNTQKSILIPKWVGDAVRQNSTLKRLALPLRRMLEKKLGVAIVDEQYIDINRSLAATAGPLTGTIYVNPKLSNEERNDVKEDIIKKLSSIDGIEAYDKYTLYRVNMNSQPDIPDILLNSSKYDFSRFGNTSIVKSRVPNHRRDGVIMMIGDVFGNTPQKASLLDLAPTILHLMNVPVLSDMQGRVLSETFKNGSEPAGRDVRYIHPVGSIEKDRIRKRLRKM